MLQEEYFKKIRPLKIQNVGSNSKREQKKIWNGENMYLFASNSATAAAEMKGKVKQTKPNQKKS